MTISRALLDSAAAVGAALVLMGAGTAVAEPPEPGSSEELVQLRDETSRIFQRNLAYGTNGLTEHRQDRLKLKYDRRVELKDRDMMLRFEAPMSKDSVLRLKLFF